MPTYFKVPFERREAQPNISILKIRSLKKGDLTYSAILETPRTLILQRHPGKKKSVDIN